jgi:hypothetical protein
LTTITEKLDNRSMGRPKSLKPRELTSLRIEAASILALKHIAATDTGVYSERSVNWLIERAVKEFIERNAQPTQPQS